MQKNQFIFGLLLVLLGGVLAAYVQTDGGRIALHDVRFVGAAGNAISAYLYVPDSASMATPAPAVLAIHGYINTRETQSGFAIELARRGFVVLALDQTGHGYSDPPAFAHGFGGPDGLAYLRSLPFVDKNRVGLEGHSMGGWAVQMAAAADPDGYQAMVLEGSSTGTFGAPDGNAETPRNLLVVFSRYDEFSALMWGALIAPDITVTDKLKTLFGTTDDVVIGRLYGDLAAGNARKLMMPGVTHPGDHLSTEAIGDAVDWLELTLAEGRSESQGQTWYWKEIGTLLALVGLVILIFPLAGWLLGLAFFRELKTLPPAPVSLTSRQYVVNVLVTMLVPVITFFPFQTIGNVLLPPNPVLPQQITNGILVWAWGTGLITLGLFFLWYRKLGLSLDMLGAPPSMILFGRALVLALLLGLGLYLVVLAADFFLKIDFRFWVVALKHMSPDQAMMFVLYLPLFTVFFLVQSLSLHTQLRRDDHEPGRIWANGLILSAGFVLLLLVQYVPMLAGERMTIPSQPLLTIVAFQFVPILFAVGLISTFCFARTNNIYTGAVVNSVLVTWYMVAGTATQVVPFWF